MSMEQGYQATFTSIAPRFAVSSLGQALTFYEQLGFVTTYQDEGFAIVERDEIDLHLNPFEASPIRHSVCWIGVNNIEVLYQEYLSINVIASPLVAQPWGLKEFSIRDPFGNLILFAEGSAEEARSEEEV